MLENRRHFLARSKDLLGLAAVGLVLGDKKPSEPEKSALGIPDIPCTQSFLQDCKTPVAFAEYQNYQTLLLNLCKPINQLLPENKQAEEIYFDQTPNLLNGLPGIRDNDIHVYTPERKSIPLGIIEMIVFHEAAHNFDSLNIAGYDIPSDALGITFYQEALNDRDRNKIFDIFRESSYLDSDYYKGVMGHPQSGPFELYASALNTLRFYPDEFTHKTSREPKNIRDTSLKVARQAIESLITYSAIQIEPSDLPFDKKLMEFLGLVDAA